MDKELIKLCLTKSNLEQLAPHVVKWSVSTRTWSVLELLKSYFRDNPTEESVDIASLIVFMSKDAARMGEHEFVLHEAAINAAAEAKEETVNKLKEHLIDIATATEIYHDMDSFIKGTNKSGLAGVLSKVQKYEDKKLAAISNDVFVAPDVSHVVQSVTATGLEWRLEELNISCGPIRKGDFCIVAAYVNTGKTTFVASEVSYMAAQLPEDKSVIWVNNEEDSDKVFFRVLQATLGCKAEDIVKDPNAALGRYETIMGRKDKILVLKNNREFRKQNNLEVIFKKYDPGLIVFDTMDKIESVSYDKEERYRLGNVYNWGRDLSHMYCPILAVSQTNAQGETTKWITQSMLRESKQDKPAEGDLILAIGLDLSDPTLKKERYINVAKNKLFGGPRSLESERDGRWVVTIDNERARYVGTKSK